MVTLSISLIEKTNSGKKISTKKKVKVESNFDLASYLKASSGHQLGHAAFSK